MAQTFIYKNYTIKLEYFKLNESIQIEIEDLDNKEKYSNIIKTLDIEIKNIKKFYTILSNAFESKPNYYVKIEPIIHESTNKLAIEVKLNYDDLVDLTETIYLDNIKIHENIFQVKLNAIEEKFNSKIKDVELSYKNQIEILVETNKVLQEQIQEFNSKIEDVELLYKNQIETIIETNKMLQGRIIKLNKIVDNIEKEQVIIIQKDIIINKYIDILDLDSENVKSLSFHIKLNKVNNRRIQRFNLPKIEEDLGFNNGSITYFNNLMSNYALLNIKKIKVSKIFQTNYIEANTFIDYYLSNRQDFVVDEIEIHDNRLIDTLIKYSNYEKLVIKYDKNFNDHKIKAHCQTNNIEFDYIK